MRRPPRLDKEAEDRLDEEVVDRRRTHTEEADQRHAHMEEADQQHPLRLMRRRSARAQHQVELQQAGGRFSQRRPAALIFWDLRSGSRWRLKLLG
jgi:hypothetical protein